MTFADNLQAGNTFDPSARSSQHPLADIERRTTIDGTLESRPTLAIFIKPARVVNLCPIALFGFLIFTHFRFHCPSSVKRSATRCLSPLRDLRRQ